MNQREAVYEATVSIIGKEFEDGMNCHEWFKARPALKEKLVANLAASLDKGDWSIKKEQENIKTYITGLIANYFRKDINLNGGDKYVPATTGTRTSNKQIKAMRGLLKKFAEGSDEHARLTKGIEAAVAVERAKKLEATIDVENLPEEFQDLVG